MGAFAMKRIFFRTSMLAPIVAMCSLAIGLSPRANGYEPQSNPLRSNEVGPVDTPPPSDNPLRDNTSRNNAPRRAVPRDVAVRPASSEEPVAPTSPPQRIQFTVGGNATTNSASSAGSPMVDDHFRPAQPSFLPTTSTSRPIGPRLNLANDAPADYPSMGMPASNGTGQPGGKQLEGPQSPQLSVQKIVPPEVQVGRPAVFRVVVRNTGQIAADDVEVVDKVPRGTRLLGTAPKAATGPRGELVWSLGTIKPGAEAAVEMQLMPTDEGEVGSVASVRFQAEATARSLVTRPKLVVTTAGSPSVLMGDETTMTFTVSNPGSGIATGVVLEEHIPAALKHPGGSELEYTVGDLRPGESRQLQLKLKAVLAGAINNVVTARGDANLHAEHRFNVQINSPQLDIAMNGPKRRYLEREATYQLSVSNPGTAPAQQVELVAYLPAGLKFVNANNAGRYDANTRAVYWRLEELPVNEHGTVELVTMPVEPGQFSIKVHGAAQRGLQADKEQPVLVEGLAAVLFQLSHTKDPLEIGGETTYEISVVNQGSKAATNLQLAVFLPPELKPLAAEGPTHYTIENNKVVFENMPQLGQKSAAAFRVRAQGVRAGDLRVRCQLKTDEMQSPIVKEESTRVYADE